MARVARGPPRGTHPRLLAETLLDHVPSCLQLSNAAKALPVEKANADLREVSSLRSGIATVRAEH